jgi:hypothetical protein
VIRCTGHAITAPRGSKNLRVHVELSDEALPVVVLEEPGKNLSAGGFSERARGGVGEMGIEGADNATHFENSVGLGQVKVVPSDDQWIKPVVRMSSSSSME